MLSVNPPIVAISTPVLGCAERVYKISNDREGFRIGLCPLDGTVEKVDYPTLGGLIRDAVDVLPIQRWKNYFRISWVIPNHLLGLFMGDKEPLTQEIGTNKYS